MRRIASSPVPLRCDCRVASLRVNDRAQRPDCRARYKDSPKPDNAEQLLPDACARRRLRASSHATGSIAGFVAAPSSAGFCSDDAELTKYTREFPVPANADYYGFLDLVLRNDLSESEASRLHARSRNYAQFLRLLSAIERAEALDARVLVD